MLPGSAETAWKKQSGLKVLALSLTLTLTIAPNPTPTPTPTPTPNQVVLDTPEDDGTAMIKETTFSNTQWGQQPITQALILTLR